MIVNKNNIASINGVEKAGFKAMGIVRKSKILKIYRRVKDV